MPCGDITETKLSFVSGICFQQIPCHHINFEHQLAPPSGMRNKWLGNSRSRHGKHQRASIWNNYAQAVANMLPKKWPEKMSTWMLQIVKLRTQTNV